MNKQVSKSMPNTPLIDDERGKADESQQGEGGAFEESFHNAGKFSSSAF